MNRAVLVHLRDTLRQAAAMTVSPTTLALVLDALLEADAPAAPEMWHSSPHAARLWREMTAAVGDDRPPAPGYYTDNP